MARLTKNYSSDDEFPDIDVLLKQGPPRKSKTSTSKALKPLPTETVTELPLPQTRKVRRLGGLKSQDLDNPLLQRWDTGEYDDGIPTISSIEPSKTNARSRVPSQPTRRTKTSSLDARSTSPEVQTRPTRNRRPRISPELADDTEEEGSEEESDSGSSLQQRIRVLKTRQTRDDNEEPRTDVTTHRNPSLRSGRTVSGTSNTDRSTLKPRPCLESAHKRNDAGEEDDSVYQTAAEPDSDQSEDSYSDFTPDDSFGSIRVQPSTRHAKDNEESQGSKRGKRGEVSLSTKPSENSSRSKKNGTVDADLANTFSKLRLQMLDFSDDESQPPRGKRPTTPPPSEKSSRPKGLVSPKKAAFIPMTPHKSSSDAFWSQDLVDGWNDKHSPRKPIFAPKASSPVKSSPSKESKKSFAEKRQAIAESFLRELDDEITQGRIRELALSTGGVRLVWSKTLNTTAGRANWKRETVRTKQGSAQDAKITEAAPRHHAWIELAEKVIDDEDRLLNTLAHEFCHLATFMIDGITTNPHGQHFKAWAAKCSRAFGRRGVEVTTKHSYAIDFKYIWQCGTCLAEYKRHSRSIDPVRHRCGSCKGVLAQIKPAPRKNNTGSGGGAKLSEYQIFMKDEMKIVRGENPGSPQKEVMRIVAERWAKKNGRDKPKSKGVAGVDGVVDKLEVLTVEDDD